MSEHQQRMKKEDMIEQIYEKSQNAQNPPPVLESITSELSNNDGGVSSAEDDENQQNSGPKTDLNEPPEHQQRMKKEDMREQIYVKSQNAQNPPPVLESIASELSNNDGSVSSSEDDEYQQNSAEDDEYQQNSAEDDEYQQNSAEDDEYQQNSAEDDEYQQNSAEDDEYQQNSAEDDEYQQNSGPKTNLNEPPDGGHGWVLVMASVIVYTIFVGFVKSFSIIFLELKKMFPTYSSYALSWVPAIMTTVGPFMCRYCQNMIDFV